MKYLDDFRDRKAVLGFAERVAELVKGRETPVTFMEVCGTHTMAIYQYGIRSLLPPGVRLISGPGCPVCVTPIGYVDKAVAFSRSPGTIIATFGDMLRVPGTSSSLQEERARGADIRIVYSPLDAVKLAARTRERRVVFLGVGFETTAPTVAGSVVAAKEGGIDNFFVLASHKTIPGAMEILTADPELGLDGYLCPAHVSAIIGADAYTHLAVRHGIPCVVTGFEPTDVMQGVEMLVRQVVEERAAVEIQYSRVVKREGNRKAQEMLSRVFVPCDSAWRGIGIIPGSGLAFSEEFASFDAEVAIEADVEDSVEPEGCLCGEILRGKVTPLQCPLFGGQCTPESPVGACMVSSEGTCAAAYKYGM